MALLLESGSKVALENYIVIVTPYVLLEESGGAAGVVNAIASLDIGGVLTAAATPTVNATATLDIGGVLSATADATASTCTLLNSALTLSNTVATCGTITPANGDVIVLCIIANSTVQGDNLQTPSITDTIGTQTWTRFSLPTIVQEDTGNTARGMFTYACIVSNAQTGTVTVTTANTQSSMVVYAYAVTAAYVAEGITKTIIGGGNYYHNDRTDTESQTNLPLQALASENHFLITFGISVNTSGTVTAVSPFVIDSLRTVSAAYAAVAGHSKGSILPSASWTNPSQSHWMQTAIEVRTNDGAAANQGQAWWLAHGSGVIASTTFTTSAITRHQTGEVFLAVTVRNNAALRTVTGVSGCAATWTLVGQASYGTAASPTSHVSLWRGSGTITDGQAITVTTTGTGVHEYVVTEVVGISGVVHSAVSIVDSTDTPTTTLATPAAANMTLGVLATNSGNYNPNGYRIAPDSGYELLDDMSQFADPGATLRQTLAVIWRRTPTTQVSGVQQFTADTAAIGVELGTIPPSMVEATASLNIGGTLAATAVLTHPATANLDMTLTLHAVATGGTGSSGEGGTPPAVGSRRGFESGARIG